MKLSKELQEEHERFLAMSTEEKLAECIRLSIEGHPKVKRKGMDPAGGRTLTLRSSQPPKHEE